MSIQDPYEQQQPYTAPGAPTAYDPVAGGSVDPGSIPPPPPGGYGPGFVPGPGAPNPMLAALLGFIPGVGAMYNGQFAKGIAHIAIFAVFSSLAKHVNDIFGLFVAGWIFYMVFEAYQTARARREGLPMPDPFGLNNIGERFGFKGNPDFSHFWGHNGGPPPNATAASETRVDPDGGFYRTRVDASGRQTTFEVDPTGNVYRTTGYGAVPPVPPPPPGYVPPMPPPGATPYGYGAAPYGAPGYGMPPVPGAPGVPPVSPYSVPPVSPIPPAPPVPRGGLPTGAVWLIGLGFFALLGSVHQFAFLEGEATGGLFLIALAAFLFWRRYSANDGMYPPGSPAARWNLIRASKGAGVVFIVGLLTFLQGLHIVAWASSWPLLLIFFGVALLLERTALNGMNSEGGFHPSYAASPVPPPPVSAEPEVETNSPTSIVPKYTRPGNDLSSHNEEGR